MDESDSGPIQVEFFREIPKPADRWRECDMCHEEGLNRSTIYRRSGKKGLGCPSCIEELNR